MTITDNDNRLAPGERGRNRVNRPVVRTMPELGLIDREAHEDLIGRATLMRAALTLICRGNSWEAARAVAEAILMRMDASKFQY